MRCSSAAPLALMALVLLVGCGPDGAGPTPDPQDAVAADVLPGDVPSDAPSDIPPDVPPDVPTWPPFAPAVCGAPEYTWLPPAAVGGVVTFEPTSVLGSLTAEQVNALIAAATDEEIVMPYGARNFRLRYVTQDRGAAREATALVGLPAGLPAGERPPIVLFLHGSTGAMDDCAPSRDAANGPLVTTIFAALGYVAVAPDYLGLVGFGEPSPAGTIHPYLAGEPTAIASLDAVRAALAGAADGADLAQGDPARIVLLGGSQGGHAVFVTERWAPHYAPELGLVAAIALAPPTDLLGIGTWAVDQPGLPARSFVGALTALWDWYGRTVPLSGALTDQEPLRLAAAAPEWMATSCDGLRAVDPLPVEEVFAPGLLAAARAGRWEDAPPWGCYLAENSPRYTSVPRGADTPFLVVQGELDDLVPASAERADVAALCAQGYEIEYLECAGGGHSVADVQTVFYLLDWIEARLAGEPLPAEGTCVVGAPVSCAGL